MSYIRQGQLFTFESFISEEDDNTRLVMILSALEPYLAPLVAKLGRERMGRRDDYPIRVLMNAFVAGYVYQIPVKNELIRELKEKRESKTFVRNRKHSGYSQLLAVQQVYWQACQR